MKTKHEVADRLTLTYNVCFLAHSKHYAIFYADAIPIRKKALYFPFIVEGIPTYHALAELYNKTDD